MAEVHQVMTQSKVQQTQWEVQDEVRQAANEILVAKIHEIEEGKLIDVQLYMLTLISSHIS